MGIEGKRELFLMPIKSLKARVSVNYLEMVKLAHSIFVFSLVLPLASTLISFG
jgi:hypothetical protein